MGRGGKRSERAPCDKDGSQWRSDAVGGDPFAPFPRWHATRVAGTCPTRPASPALGLDLQVRSKPSRIDVCPLPSDFEQHTTVQFTHWRSRVLGRFSTYLEAVAQSLPHQHRKLVRGDLYLTLLAWYTEGVPAKDAALRLKRALAGS